MSLGCFARNGFFSKGSSRRQLEIRFLSLSRMQVSKTVLGNDRQVLVFKRLQSLIVNR